VYTLLITRGKIVDGTGSPPFKGCLAVEGDKIVFVGRGEECRELDAKKIIDAEGLYVAPGFIDLHSHFDETIIMYPQAESALLQGITTGVGGNCGFSLAPLTEWWLWSFWDEEVFQKIYPYKYYPASVVVPLDEVKPLLKEVLGLEIKWSSFKEYIEYLESLGIGINLALQVGHNTVRAQVMGRDYRRRAKNEEIAEMKRLVEEAMEAGAVGFSTGLDYEPGAHADTEEIVELAKIVARYGGLYSTHWRRTGVRREASRALPAKIRGVLEAVEVGERAGVKVEISHILPGYVVYPDNEELWRVAARETLKVVEEGQRKGIDVGFDVIPTSTGGVFKVRYLASLLAPWLRGAGSLERLGHLLRAEDFRREVRQGILEGRVFHLNPLHLEEQSKHIVIVKTEFSEVKGLNLREAAAKLNMTVVDAILEILAQDPRTEIEVLKSPEVHEAALEELVKHPSSSVVTDTFVLNMKWELKVPPYYLPHPNTYGCFPRFIRKFVVEKKLLSVEEAIKKITSIPAMRAGIKNRGLLKPGYFADIVVFDLNTLDHPLTGDPRVQPRGIRYVIVNGAIAVENGRITGIRAGRVLLRGENV